MQTFKSASRVIGTTLPILLAACTADEPISSRSNYVDSGKGGTSEMGPSGTSGSVSGGGSVSNGGSGANLKGGDIRGGVAGEAAAAGSTGSAGSIGADASDDGHVSDVVEAGPLVPEASTCAGFALQFTGAGDYAYVNRVVQDDFTLEAWLKTNQASLTGVNVWEGTGLIYADQLGVTNDFGASMLNGHLTMGVGNPDTTLQGTSLIDTGQWVHIATTRRKSTGEFQIIVNGKLEASTTGQTAALTAPPIITIGGNIIDGRYLTGTMDELRIWSVVRTPTEITNTMHKTLTGSETGLVGYWNFDEGTGGTSADQTSGKGGGDAPLINGPKWVPSDAPICP